MHKKMLAGMMLLWTGVVLITAGWMFDNRTAAAAEAAGQPDWAANVIRLHVVANSDSDGDQALKRAVRDAILAEVTPLFKEATSPEEARAAIALATPRIEQVAAATIAAHGYAYRVRAELGRFAFPGKSYGAFYLPAGEYTALRVAIGKAEGANWWCVLFPPLCFADWTSGVVLEPKPGTGGLETVTVPREKLAALLTEEQLEQMPVKVRFALFDWLKSKGIALPFTGSN
jgi:stage II sporulation protein R